VVDATDRNRRGLLIGEREDAAVGRQEMPLFGTWMSRDSVFLAPPDAQKAMIQQWFDCTL
jgi:hypothetical protein